MDDEAFIAALQLTDSFFPSGVVTLSHGLETFLSDQAAAIDLSQLLHDYLERKIAPCDLVAYAHAYRAAAQGDAERLHQIDRYLDVRSCPKSCGRAQRVRAGELWKPCGAESGSRSSRPFWLVSTPAGVAGISLFVWVSYTVYGVSPNAEAGVCCCTLSW